MKILILLGILVFSQTIQARIGGDGFGGGGGGASMMAENFFNSSNIGNLIRYDSLNDSGFERVNVDNNLFRALENRENGERIRLSNFRDYLNENSTPSFFREF